MIYIVGLGPGDPELITLKTWRILTSATEVWVRTRRHPAAEALAAHRQIHSYDSLYDAHDDFPAIYSAIATDVVLRGVAGDIVYAVPGDPGIAEATTGLIVTLARGQGVAVEIHPGVSFLEPTFQALAQDPISGVQIVDATTLAAAHHPPGSARQGMLVAQLYSRLLASDVKLTLMNAYPDEHAVTLVSGARAARALPLHKLDHGEHFDDFTTLWVPPLPQASDYNDLQDVIARLRAPDGCPWDREQTHESLRPYLLEEAYEVLEAIDADAPDALVEELGDLLIQVALHVQIASEEGEFRLGDVIAHVVAKLIRRHPHVFGDVEASDATTVIRNWEAIKQQERNHQPHKTLLDGIPRTLPALALAQTYVSRLARVGYALDDATLDETTLALVLLNLVEQAQSAGLDAESALRNVAADLRRRAQEVEQVAARTGRPLTELTLAEQRALWATVGN